MERSTSLEDSSVNGVAADPNVSCNLENVHKFLADGLVGSDDVDLECYVNAYKELYNFFALLGGVFGFVASDVKDKIKILDDYREESKSGNFQTVSKMMDFEMQNNMLTEKKYISGSRTLLRLHRGLDFVRKFLADVYKLDDNAKTGDVCRIAYDATLGNFHSWTIRKSAQIAIKFMPVKKDLVNKITRGDATVAARTVAIMPDMFTVMAEVYQRVDDLYTKNKLHDLS